MTLEDFINNIPMVETKVGTVRSEIGMLYIGYVASEKFSGTHVKLFAQSDEQYQAEFVVRGNEARPLDDLGGN